MTNDTTPAPGAPAARFVKPRTVGELAAEFFGYLERRAAGRTAAYYRSGLGRWVQAVGADLALGDVIPLLVERHCRTWHATQAVKRAFAWGAGMGLLAASPVASVPLPPRGQRERVLSRAEGVRLLRGAGRAFRDYMLGMLESLARPQEVRALRWDLLRPDGAAFLLPEFKCKARRRDGVRLRVIAVSARLGRLLARLRRRPAFDPAGHVFLNGLGRPWTANAVRCRMRRLRERLGMGGGAERLCAYHLRHTGATNAMANGLSDRLLGELLGHVPGSPMTSRYQHPRLEHLAAAIEKATRRPRAG